MFMLAALTELISFCAVGFGLYNHGGFGIFGGGEVEKMFVHAEILHGNTAQEFRLTLWHSWIWFP